jgi:DNA-directed RNA polymerase subunit RPC12/RpoP
MTMLVEDIEVTCPECGHVFMDWIRSSFNRSLPVYFSDEYMDRATSATCPKCGFKVYFETLITERAES